MNDVLSKLIFHRRSRSNSRRGNSEDRIDKKRLLEVARKNAITMLKNGTLPGVQNLAADDKEKALAKMRYGGTYLRCWSVRLVQPFNSIVSMSICAGKSVDELTEFCKMLSKGDTTGYLSNVTDSEDDADIDKPFNHPFVLKDRGPIVMNIKVNEFIISIPSKIQIVQCNSNTYLCQM